METFKVFSLSGGILGILITIELFMLLTELGWISMYEMGLALSFVLYVLALAVTFVLGHYSNNSVKQITDINHRKGPQASARIVGIVLIAVGMIAIAGTRYLGLVPYALLIPARNLALRYSQPFDENNREICKRSDRNSYHRIS